jgi:hypothetical protein
MGASGLLFLQEIYRLSPFCYDHQTQLSKIHNAVCHLASLRNS